MKRFFPIIIIFFLLVLISPVFVSAMKSNNYYLQLESSDINAISQDSIDDLNPVDDFKRNINVGNTASNTFSNTNYKLIKASLLGLLLIFLIIFYFKQIRTKFEIKRKR